MTTYLCDPAAEAAALRWKPGEFNLLGAALCKVGNGKVASVLRPATGGLRGGQWNRRGAKI